MIGSFLETGVLAPQEGPQETFATTPADIAIYGGSAFGGKTMALLMECLRHVSRQRFSAVIFRRTYPEIVSPGGLWESSEMFYPALGGVPRQSDCEWVWPDTGSKVKFAHLQHEKDKFSWMGSQIPLLEFDELTHFTESMFWYLVSRNRLGSPIGMKPYVRASCNPDSASWVATLLEWWIDQETGFPIPERSGVLRWFVRHNGQMLWAENPAELAHTGLMPKSLTFVASKVFDNKIGMAADPGYLGNLQALPSFERAQLLDGNWKITPSRGTRFKRHWFEVVDSLPTMQRKIRYWDRAATEVSERNKDPDATAGVKWELGDDSYYYITDVVVDKITPGAVKRLIRETANQDGMDCEPWLEQDPGQAGVAERDDYSEYMAKYGPRFQRPTGSKWIRSGPFSAAAENGRVRVLRAPWNKVFFDELEAFQDPDHMQPGEAEGHDDQVDAASGGFTVISAEGTPRVRSA